MDSDAIRTIERLCQPRPVINPDDFPQLDLYERSKYRQEMRPFYRSLHSDNYCRAYVRTDHKGEWFVDIYFIENFKDIRKRSERRFVIKSGFLMTTEDESDFLGYLHRTGIIYDHEMVNDFIENIREVAPEFNIWGFMYFPMILEHTYFAASKSGIRELLYKAGGLNEIAFMLDCIDDINLCEDTIAGTMGMPLNMLRKFNSPEMVYEVLRDPDNRQRAADIYKRYHRNLNKTEILTIYQFKYLDECFVKDEIQEISGSDNVKNCFNKEIFKCLGKLFWWEDEDISENGQTIPYDEIMTFINWWKDAKMSFGKLAHMIDEDSDEDESFWHCFRIAREYLKNKAEIDDEYAVIYDFLVENYSYSNDKFIIDFPKKENFVFDIICEANRMNNCLAGYMERILDGSATILYIRSKENPDKSLVDVELRGNSLYQAWRSCNRELTGEQLDFLDEFMQKKGICKFFEDGDFDLPFGDEGELDDLFGAEEFQLVAGNLEPGPFEVEPVAYDDTLRYLDAWDQAIRSDDTVA